MSHQIRRRVMIMSSTLCCQGSVVLLYLVSIIENPPVNKMQIEYEMVLSQRSVVPVPPRSGMVFEKMQKANA